jgi:hypothetical protein
MDLWCRVYVSSQMKVIPIIFILLLTSTECVHAQSVSVDFSIEWQTEKNLLMIDPFDASDTLVDVPYLLIRCQNHSPNDVYFKAPILKSGEYPNLINFSESHARIDLSDRAARKKNRYDENFMSRWIILLTFYLCGRSQIKHTAKRTILGIL